MTTKTAIGQGIVQIKARRKGPTIGIVCNVHGNELCGRNGVHRVLSKYDIERGSLILIDGNQEAALLNKRYVESDMNRMFTKEQLKTKNAQNDLRRAQYLAKVVPTLGLDYAIDFHSTSSETKYPFTVSFPGSEELTELCPAARIYGWTGVVPGTLVDYMNLKGIPTVVVEAGQHVAESSIKIAEKTVLSVLSHYKMIKPKKPVTFRKQPTFEVLEQVMVGHADSFKFTRQYSSFDKVAPGERIARDKKREYLVPQERGLYVLMPALQKNVTDKTSPGAYYLMKKTQ